MIKTNIDELMKDCMNEIIKVAKNTANQITEALSNEAFEDTIVLQRDYRGEGQTNKSD